MKNIEVARLFVRRSDEEIIEKLCPHDVGGTDHHPSPEVSAAVIAARDEEAVHEFCVKCWNGSV